MSTYTDAVGDVDIIFAGGGTAAWYPSLTTEFPLQSQLIFSF